MFYPLEILEFCTHIASRCGGERVATVLQSPRGSFWEPTKWVVTSCLLGVAQGSGSMRTGELGYPKLLILTPSDGKLEMRKPRPRKPRPRLPPSPQNSPSAKPGWIKRNLGLSIMSFVALCIAITGLTYAIRPNVTVVSVSPSQTKDDPFNPVFTFENTGKLSAYDVTFPCLKVVRSSPVSPSEVLRFKANAQVAPSGEAGNNWDDVPELHAGERIAKSCIMKVATVGQPVGPAIVSFKARYRPLPFAWYTIEREFSYQSRAGSGAELNWIPVSYLVLPPPSTAEFDRQ
jgi:hypothetical protein